MNLTQLLHDLYQNGHIVFGLDGSVSYSAQALSAIASFTEQTPALAIVRNIHETAQSRKAGYSADLKAALRMH